MANIRTIMRECMEVGENVFFSIIVPVYKVEKYLEECIKSITSQSFGDFELILVDDGSPDRCPEICDEYGVVDKRIRVIHKSNGGLSSARNAGLEKAMGDYIIFIDSDDVLNANALRSIYEALRRKPEILITEIYNTEDVTRTIEKNELFICPMNTEKSEVVGFVFRDKMHTWASVQYIVSNEFIKKNNLIFDNGYYHEDVSWTAQIFALATKFEYYNAPWYIRRIGRSGSITTVINSKRTVDTITLVAYQMSEGPYDHLDDNEKKVIFNQMARAVLSSLIYFRSYNNDEKKLVCNLLNKNIFVLKYANTFRHRVFYILLRLVGPAIMLRLTTKRVGKG